MPQLPTGTVTFLFSDIEGSTRLAEERPADWPAILARHRVLMREAFAAQDGVEVGTEGDSFFAAFPSASGAVAAAVDALRQLGAESWPGGLTVRIRIGMHTGEAAIQDGTYVGVAVHRAARISELAHGGQVLLSGATRSLVVESLPDGVTLRGLGQHRLRDLDSAEELSQLVVEGLEADFPPIRSVGTTPNNLPPQATSFLGRDEEIAEVSALLGGSRLVTLTGPGGTGKTRLSLQVAASVVDRYPDGVTFVPLGPISETDLVLPTIADELGLADRGGAQPMERLKAHLGERTTLLVLDNFEQILDAAPAVGELLAASPGLSVLVTSRSPLHVYGEHEYPVPPLDVPDPARLPPLAALSQFESVALFVDRARAALPSFAVTNENAPAVAELCVRLDGLPLAIELAAARIKLLTPQQMLDRLGQSLTLLAGGSRDLPARQQTLRGAIQWSYDLLDEGDRRIFAAFALFVGGATFEAVDAVCTEPDVDVFECLVSLVDKSLIRRSDAPTGDVRFSMLDTIREYAAETLVASGRREELRERHAAWYLGLAERVQPSLMGSEKGMWLDRLTEEHDNLRAAHAWAIETGRVEMAMRLVGALWRFWQMRGYLAEGLDRAKAALALPEADQHPECLVRALDAAGGLAYWTGDGQIASAYYERALELQRRLGDRAGEAWTLYSLAFTDTYWGNIAEQRFTPERLDRAAENMREAIEIYREIGDRQGMAQALWGAANVMWTQNPPVDSAEFRAAGDNAREALAIFQEADNTFMIGWCTYTLALLDLRLDDLPMAHDRLAASLRIFRDAGDVTGYVLVLDALALHAQRTGDLDRAARLSGAVSVLERRTGTGLNPPNRVALGFEPETLRQSPDTAQAWEDGMRLTADEAVAYALGEVAVAGP
jgi:predicted ATPase/class 3 adenylate cyclase